MWGLSGLVSSALWVAENAVSFCIVQIRIEVQSAEVAAGKFSGLPLPGQLSSHMPR
jgi:hypothetical protein